MAPMVLVSNREENRMRKNLSEILKDALNAGITSSNVEVSFRSLKRHLRVFSSKFRLRSMDKNGQLCLRIFLNP